MQKYLSKMRFYICQNIYLYNKYIYKYICLLYLSNLLEQKFPQRMKTPPPRRQRIKKTALQQSSGGPRRYICMKMNIIRLKLNCTRLKLIFSSMIFNFITLNSIYICLKLNFTTPKTKFISLK